MIDLVTIGVDASTSVTNTSAGVVKDVDDRVGLIAGLFAGFGGLLLIAAVIVTVVVIHRRRRTKEQLAAG